MSTKILIACESTQVITSAFRAAGYEAYSCDILPAEIEPAWHYQGDVRDILIDDWRLMIAHPPCTYLSRVSSPAQYADRTRILHTLCGRQFFLSLLSSDIPLIAIENPVPAAWARLPRPTQYIDPTEFGENYTKRTGLWLKGLPPLLPTHCYNPHAESWNTWCANHISSRRRGKVRANWWPKVAAAMVQQWKQYL